MASLDEETDQVLEEFLVYFETTWVGVLQRGRRRRPQFDISMWNVREKTLLGIPRRHAQIVRLKVGTAHLTTNVSRSS